MSTSGSCIPEALQHVGSDHSGAVHAENRESEVWSGPTGGVESRPERLGDRPTSSVFSRDENAPVHVVPMRVIHRPLPSELDESKVQAFMDEMRAGDVFTPIEVVKVRTTLKTDPSGALHNFYFAMGGCHRYEATKRLGLETIRAKIIDVPPAAMRVYLGAGCPF